MKTTKRLGTYYLTNCPQMAANVKIDAIMKKYLTEEMKCNKDRWLICTKSYEYDGDTIVAGELDYQRKGMRFPVSGLWRRATLDEVDGAYFKGNKIFTDKK